MKIMHLSDIHGDFKTFDKVANRIKESDADVVAITGDVSGKVFDDEKEKSFIKTRYIISNEGESIYRASDGKIKTLQDIALFEIGRAHV